MQMTLGFGTNNALSALGQYLIHTRFQVTRLRLDARIIDAPFAALLSVKSLGELHAALDLEYERLVL